MQAPNDAMITWMLKAAAIVGRERPEIDAARISTAVTTASTAARDHYRMYDAPSLELTDCAMARLDDGLDGSKDGEEG